MNLTPPNQPDGVQTPANKLPPPSIPQSILDRMAGKQILENPGMPKYSRSKISEYSRSIRYTDSAMLKLFQNVRVMDEESRESIVPIVWGPPEKAVAVALSEAASKSEIHIDRVKLPIMALSGGSMNFDPDRFTPEFNILWHTKADGSRTYHKEKYPMDTIYGTPRGLPVNREYKLYIWTSYQEDMSQILEQVLLKFSPIATLEIPTIKWEVIVTADSAGSAISDEIGDAAIRILKYELGMTAQTYISQGVVRGKTVFDMKVGVTDSEGNSILNIVEETPRDHIEEKFLDSQGKS